MVSVLGDVGGRRVERPRPGKGTSGIGDPRSPGDAVESTVLIDPTRT